MSHQQEPPRLSPSQPDSGPGGAAGAGAGQAGPAETGRRVFRGPGAVVLWWIWVVIAAASLGDLAVQGRDHAAAVAAAVVAAITGVLYAAAQRPRIVADGEGVTVANPVREYRVPWSVVEGVDVRGALRVHCGPGAGETRGRVVHSWAVQGSPRASMRQQPGARREELRSARMSSRRGRRPVAAPPPAQRGPDRVSAEYVAADLTERMRRARGSFPDAPAGGRLEARWVWESVAAVVVPLLLLVAVALA